MSKPFLKRRLVVLTAWLSLAAITGCGYTTRSGIGERFRTIAIKQFANKIDITKEGDSAAKYKLYKPLLEQDITNEVVSRFILDGNLKLAKFESADLSLEGELTEFTRDAVRYTSNDDVEEYRISIRVTIKLIDNAAGKVLWEEKAFMGDTTYFTQGPNAKTDDEATNDAVKDISRRIVERVVEQW